MQAATANTPKPDNLDAHIEDDLLVARIRGAYDESVARHLEWLFIELADQYGYSLALLNASQTTTITPQARRLMAQWDASRKEPGAGAVVGASFTTKTVAKMLIRAAKLLSTSTAHFDFFDTEAEARAWLNQQRAKLKKERR
jgi:hypothetical protein